MVQTTPNTTKIYYRYKLNDNAKSSTMSINTHKLTDKWTIFPKKIDDLDSYIRTKDFPDKPVDYEQFDRVTGATIQSSVVNFNKRFPTYTRDTLASMPRTQIFEICKSYNISTINKRVDFLINRIIEKQEVYREFDNVMKEQKLNKKLEDIAENKINEILNKRNEILTEIEKKRLKVTVIEELKDFL